MSGEQAPEHQKLLALALAALARREYSQWELRRKLAEHCEDTAVIEAVLGELAERGWQSDERFAQAWVAAKARRSGSLKLKHTLRGHGVDEAVVQDLMPAREDEEAAALAIIQRKYRRYPTGATERAKVMRFLQYRGFGADIVQAALRRWRGEEGETEEREESY